MTPESIFSIVNLVALCAWILLALFSGRRPVTLLVTVAVPVLLAVVYVALIAANWNRTSGGFSTLSGVATLFGNPWLLLAGWIHYLAFDLLVGSWEVRDAQERGIHRLLVLPCLLLTFMFGPAGWLVYLGLRSARRTG